jgi:hypothetical protein
MHVFQQAVFHFYAYQTVAGFFQYWQFVVVLVSLAYHYQQLSQFHFQRFQQSVSYVSWHVVQVFVSVK